MTASNAKVKIAVDQRKKRSGWAGSPLPAKRAP
jgi:hypothetical protein